MDEVVTQADNIFIECIYQGHSPWEAAIKAFPMMDDPVEYAMDLIDTNVYIKQRLRGYFEKHGLSDEDIVKKFIEILDHTMGDIEPNPLMDPKTAVTVLREICKLKDLYPTASTSSTFKTPENIDPTTQAGLLKQYMKNALDMMPEQELAKRVRSPIIDIPVLEDKDVFDG